jgi:outer membrane protein
MRESAPAQRAQKKIEGEFTKRDQELSRFRRAAEADAGGPGEECRDHVRGQRRVKERELGDADRDFQRKRREFQEDLNQRRNEELAQVLEQANRAIRAIAEQEKFDIIFQDAVYANPRIDLTERVIKTLGRQAPALMTWRSRSRRSSRASVARRRRPASPDPAGRSRWSTRHRVRSPSSSIRACAARSKERRLGGDRRAAG